jgi:DNA ligase-1
MTNDIHNPNDDQPHRISRLCYANTVNSCALAHKTPPCITDIRVPCLASFKYDGIRARVLPDDQLQPRVWSRRNEFIPNNFVQELLSHDRFIGFDGELIVGAPNDPHVYTKSESGIMSIDGEPAFTFYVFDTYALHVPYVDRYTALRDRIASVKDVLPIQLVTQELINTHGELEAFEQRALTLGYEGVITRSLDGLYKHGRSTMTEQYLVKLKQWITSEARIIGYEELQHNDNPTSLDNRGLTKRSSHNANMRAGQMLGALLVEDIHDGRQFAIGSGFTTEQRIQIWNNQTYFKQMLAHYVHFPIGAKHKPRQPVFKGWRRWTDMPTDQQEV